MNNLLLIDLVRCIVDGPFQWIRTRWKCDFCWRTRHALFVIQDYTRMGQENEKIRSHAYVHGLHQNTLCPVRSKEKIFASFRTVLYPVTYLQNCQMLWENLFNSIKTAKNFSLNLSNLGWLARVCHTLVRDQRRNNKTLNFIGIFSFRNKRLQGKLMNQTKTQQQKSRFPIQYNLWLLFRRIFGK